MDEQLKRRLVGAAIIVLLAVVVVPLFFEDKSREAPKALPEPVEEHALALPKNESGPVDVTGEDANPGSVAQETPAAAPKKRKYEVVPLDDAPPPKPAKLEPVPAATVRAVPEAPREMPMADEAPAMDTPAVNATPAPAASQSKSTKPKPKSSAKITAGKSGTPKPASAKASGPAVPREASTSANKKAAPAGASFKPAKSTAPVAPKPAQAAVRPAEPVARKPAGTAASRDTAKPVTTSPAPATTPKAAAGSGKSWTVQAGTFAEESNARALTEKLQKRNLPARIHVTEGASGKVYRVTVGPNLDRSHAEKIQKQLSTQDDVKGVILQTR